MNPQERDFTSAIEDIIELFENKDYERICGFEVLHPSKHDDYNWLDENRPYLVKIYMLDRKLFNYDRDEEKQAIIKELTILPQLHNLLKDYAPVNVSCTIEHVNSCDKFNKDIKFNIKESIRRILKEEINNPNKPDLYEFAKWGLTGEYEYSGCWDDKDDLDGAIECVVNDFEEFLNDPYPTGLGNIPKNPIIYRLIKLNEIKDLNKNNLGKSWFSNPNQIKNPEFFDMLEYLKPGPNNKVFLIKGKTTINNIDLKRTLWERSTQWWENEIVIKDDSNIDILDIKELTMDKYLNRNTLKEETNPIMDLVDELGIMDAIKYTGLNYDEIKSKINLTKEQKIQFIKDFVTEYDEFEDDGGDLYLKTDERIVYKIENEEIHYIDSLKVAFDDLIINLWVYDLDKRHEATYPYMLDGEDLSDEELDMVINVILNLDYTE